MERLWPGARGQPSRAGWAVLTGVPGALEGRELLARLPAQHTLSSGRQLPVSSHCRALFPQHALLWVWR